MGRPSAKDRQPLARPNYNVSYAPLPSQERFHRSAARFKAFCGPVGTGKSKALCQEAIRLTVQNAGRLGLIGAPTFPMLRDSTQRQFLEICEESGLGYEFHREENRIQLFKSGSEILFRSLDNFERLRGPNLAWFGVDELTYTEPDAWLRLEARLRDPKARRLCGFGVFTPKGFDWVYRKFQADRRPGYELIVAKPFENKHVLQNVPDFYERLKQSYDPLFYEQEALGQFVNVRQGRAYYAFSRAANIREGEVDPALPLIWTWDFNLTPMSSLICQQRPSGEVHVIDEIVLPTSSTPEVCREFRARYGERPRRANPRLLLYGDASGGTAHTVTGTSDYYLIRQFFRSVPYFRLEMRVPAANPPVRERINAVNGRLQNAAGGRSLFVHPRCKELIQDLEQVGYKPGSSQLDKESDPARSHTSDALGYYIWHEFRPAEPIGERSERLI